MLEKIVQFIIRSYDLSKNFIIKCIEELKKIFLYITSDIRNFLMKFDLTRRLQIYDKIIEFLLILWVVDFVRIFLGLLIYHRIIIINPLEIVYIQIINYIYLFKKLCIHLFIPMILKIFNYVTQILQLIASFISRQDPFVGDIIFFVLLVLLVWIAVRNVKF
jgi:hypothetical protein